MNKAFVGVQVAGISFLDEGFGALVDRLVEHGAVNTLVVPTQSFGTVQQRRTPTDLPWSGHGREELNYPVGGSYATPHARYYAGTVLPAFRTRDPEFDGVDVLERLIPEARSRGVKVFSWIYENPYSSIAAHVPNWSRVLQVDVFGRRHRLPCFRNPSYLNWWLSIVEDQLKSYDFDGIQYGSERFGPLGNLLKGGISGVSAVPHCFCEHCRTAAEIRGIDAERAIAGYTQLYAWRQERAGSKPEGERALVLFLRALLKYPEILAWEQLWHDGFSGLQRQLYGVAKTIAPEKPVGWHVWHQNSFSPLSRAEVDFADMARYSDFIKPVLYHNCAGPRLHRHIEQLRETVFRDVSESTLFDVYQGTLGYAEKRSVEEISTAGLSGDYVRRETARVVAAVDGAAAVYPGIDVDIPTAPDEKKTTPEDVRDGVAGAFEGGADGVILSRKYSEMQLDNLAAAGQTIRELGLA
ncbi:MAG TPA: hypothetical protein VHX59_18585 [Mycobacteriales bacterium]|nr:hypothetical protein [Mycobacteriales bacterium]